MAERPAVLRARRQQTPDQLDDRKLRASTERNQFRIGQSFGSITDLVIGPDRHLYVVSIGNGGIYRISGPALVPALGLPGVSLLALLLGGGATVALGAFRARRTRSRRSR